MSTAYWFDQSPWTDYGDFHPLPLAQSTQSGHTVTQLSPSQSLRFASNSASVGIYSYFSTAAGRTYVLLQDGTEVGAVDIPASGGGAWQVFNLATGLDTGAVHEYEILCIYPVQGQIGNWYDGHVELDTGTLAAVAHPRRFTWAFYGDSITAMSNSHETDSGSPLISDCRQGDMWQVCHANGHAMMIAGTAGGKVNTAGRDNTANIDPGVDGVGIRYGTNDISDLPGGAAAFQSAYSDMVDNAIARVGTGKPMLCFQPFPRTGVDRGPIGLLIQAAIAGKARTHYISTDGWIPTNTTYLPDGLHPNIAGYASMVPLETNYLLTKFADYFRVHQTSNIAAVTEIYRRAGAPNGVPVDEVVHHSGDHPRQPDNGYVYAKHGAAQKHVYVLSGTLTLGQAQAERDGASAGGGASSGLLMMM